MMHFILIGLLFTQSLAQSTKMSCGTNRYCYYPTIDPDGDTVVDITNSDPGVGTTFDVYFYNPGPSDCDNPSISIVFELIDYNSANEYLDISDDNGNLITRCNGGQQNACGNYSECLQDHEIQSDNDTIRSGQNYKITVYESEDVHLLCGQYTINAELTLTCGGNTTQSITPYPSTYEPTIVYATTGYPTHPPTPNGEQIWCGSNKYCYSVNINDDSHTSVNISNYDDGVETTFEVTFINQGSSDCDNPLITFIFELIDYDQTHEFIELFDDNNARITTCGGRLGVSCGSFSTCLQDYDIAINNDTIKVGQSYTITIVESATVDDLCVHPFSINAELTLSCGGRNATQIQPSLSPTLWRTSYTPTSTPTINLFTTASPAVSPTRTGKTYCGTNKWCYSVNIDPGNTSIDTYTLNISNYDDSADTTFEVTFINQGLSDCDNPLLTFIFELIDYDLTYEYLDIFEGNNNALIRRCEGGQQAACGTFSTCLQNYELNVDSIGAGESYIITIFEPSDVDDLCTAYHLFSINAELTLICGASDTNFTHPTPSPIPWIWTTDYPPFTTPSPSESPTADDSNGNICAQFEGATTGPGDINWYPFEVIQTTDILIDACSSNFDTWLYFNTLNGTTIAHCDDCGDCGVQTQLEVNDTDPGHYLIGIGGWGSDYGNYSIDVYCDYDGNATSPPQTTSGDGCSTNDDCGFAFECVGGLCVRDCDSFAIDDYLQCSASFIDVEYDITQINSKINMIERSITNISGEINDLDSRSELNTNAISGINEEILELQQCCEDAADAIESFGVKDSANSAQSGGNPFNFDKNTNNNPESIMDVFETKDILIIGVLLLNMMMAIYNCTYKDDKDLKGKYYETSDMDIISEEQVLK